MSCDVCIHVYPLFAIRRLWVDVLPQALARNGTRQYRDREATTTPPTTQCQLASLPIYLVMIRRSLPGLYLKLSAYNLTLNLGMVGSCTR